MIITENDFTRSKSRSDLKAIEGELKYYLDDDYEGVIETIKLLGGYIAGGAITSIFTASKINDIDVYLRNKNNFAMFAENMEEMGWEGEGTYNSLKFTKKAKNEEDTDKIVQLITKFDGEPEKIMCGFDFTVCMAAYDPNPGILISSDVFWEHVDDEVLIFNNNAEYPISSLKRLLKYAKYGFMIPQRTIFNIVFKTSGIDFSNIDNLAEQLAYYTDDHLQETLALLMDDYNEIKVLDSKKFGKIEVTKYIRPHGRREKINVRVSKRFETASRNMKIGIEESGNGDEKFIYGQMEDWDEEQEVIDIVFGNNIRKYIEDMVEHVEEKRQRLEQMGDD